MEAKLSNKSAATGVAESAGRFVVLTTNRSGSVWVMSTLNQSPDVTAQGELFLPRKRSSEPRWDSAFACRRYIETPAPARMMRPVSVFRYLDQLYSAAGTNGFKLMYAQLRSYPEILMYLLARRVRVVHLVRENHLDVLLSFAIKAKLGQAHLLRDQALPGTIRVQLPARELLHKLERLDWKQRLARRMLRSCRLPHMEISYEQLCSDGNGFQQIRDFLEIAAPVQGADDRVVKIRRGNHQDVIANYDEVDRALRNTRFACLLEPVVARCTAEAFPESPVQSSPSA